MYCPQCGKKFWFRNTFCPDCRVGLVEHPPEAAGPVSEPSVEEELPEEPIGEGPTDDRSEEPASDGPHTEPQLTRVLTAYNPALVALAESLLDAERIEYMARGADVTGFPIGPDPVEFWVRGDEADRARELLQDLHEESRPEDSRPLESEE